MAKECASCEKDVKSYEVTYKIKEGIICKQCFEDLGFSGFGDQKLIADKPFGTIKVFSEQRLGHNALIENFVPTSISQNGWIKRDDNSRQFLATNKSTLSAKNAEYTCFRYDQLLEYELIEDGDSITRGGLSRAIGGAILFGAAGAVVGGITGKRSSKATCSRLEIKLTLRECPIPTFYMTFFKGNAIQKNGFMYKTYQKEAEVILSELKIITDIVDKQEPYQSEKQTNTIDVADELRKFKGLLDDGIITQDEFDKKKNELLNL